MAKPEARIGQVLDERYRVDGLIGKGGMGVVYEATQLAVRKKVAIKCLHAHMAEREDVLTRFRREALASSAIGNEHIVDVLDFSELPDGTVYMVLEFLEGRDLSALLKEEGPLEVGRAVRLLSQLCDAIGAAHEAGVVHRDLKPENLFLIERHGDPEFLKVMDFGISKFRDAIDGVASSATKTGTALGTPYYMAPEQAQGKKEVDHRVDLYAMGVILFRMLTGHHPFDDDSYPMLVVKICTEPPPRVGLFRGDVPDGLSRLIERMLSKDPAQRPSSAAEVKAILAAWADHEAAVELLEPPSEAMRGAPAAIYARADQHAATVPLAEARELDAEQGAEEADLEGDATSPESKRIRENRENAESLPPPPPGASSPWKGVVALFAVLIAIGAGALVYQEVTADPEVEPPGLAPLPTPQPPQVRPMVAQGTGFGWTWINPLPRAMHTWNAVHAVGPNMVAMVGQQGAAARFDGSILYRFRTGTEATLRGVAWSGSEEAIAVGDEGTLLRMRIGANGQSEVRAVRSGVSVSLRAVVAPTPTEAYVLGDQGTLLRLRGGEITRMDAGTEADLLAAHVRDGTIHVVGAGGIALRLVAGGPGGGGGAAGALRVAREATGTDVALRAIGGCPRRGDLYAAGDEGTLLRRQGSGAWHAIRTDTRESWTSISCDHGRIAVAGRDGTILLVSGDRTLRLESGFDRAFNGLSAAAEGPTWAVGTGGHLATIEESHVRTRSAGPSVPIRDLADLAGRMVAVGEWGRVLREGPRGFEQADSPTEAGLADLVQVGDAHLIAVGDNGAILELRYNSARLLRSPVQASWRAAVYEGGLLLIVGADGHVARGAPEALQATRITGVGDLWDVEGSPGDAIAVGAEGVVLRLTESGSERLSCAEDHTLRDLVRTPEGLWIAGDEGRILRMEASGQGGCTLEHEGGPTLHAIGVGPEGRLIAAGDDGVVLERDAGGRWAPAEVDVGGMSVRTISSSERYVFLAGQGGAIVRHIRLDN